MQAHVGDVLIVDGKAVGRPTRQGAILEVGSPDGLPPYWVRWEHVSTMTANVVRYFSQDGPLPELAASPG